MSDEQVQMIVRAISILGLNVVGIIIGIGVPILIAAHHLDRIAAVLEKRSSND